jgi:hypothetical protein
VRISRKRLRESDEGFVDMNALLNIQEKTFTMPEKYCSKVCLKLGVLFRQWIQ